MLKQELKAKRKKSLVGWIKISKKKYKQLLQDNEDMRNARCTTFDRCNKCGRLHDTAYICFYCKHDNSLDE